MPFYHQLGFDNHPFTHTNADEEPYLERYFVPPPFFDGVVGDADHPSSAVVLAPRGGGKSAQRRRLEQWALDNSVLAVTYDRFEFAAGQKLEDITLTYHVRNIIIRTLVSYLSFLADAPDLLTRLDKPTRRTLSVFTHAYIGDMSGHALQELLKEIRTVPEKIRQFWSENVGFLESVVNVLLKRYGLDALDLPDLKQEEKKLSATYKNQLEVLRDLIQARGFRSIYVLIDKLDETERTGNSALKSYRLIQPVLQDLELLGLPGYGIKFFLWDQVLPHFRIDARPDRIPQYTLTWDRKALERVLARRVMAFSDGRIANFRQLVQADGGDIDVDAVLCLLANRSPRNLIRLCERILAVQAEADPAATQISIEAVERGILTFAEQLMVEAYGEDVTLDMQKVGRELFTINYLASSVFKTAHENTSRNRATNWQEIGLVKQIGTVLAGSKKPVNFYYVVDPMMVRLIHRGTGLSQFFKDRWLICSACGSDALMDIALIPSGNDGPCPSCGRPLL